jgi:hypothetical protein
VRARLGVLAGIAAVASTLARPAPAADASSGPLAGRLRLGLRSGFGIPFGHYAEVRTLATFRDTDVNALGDDTHGVIPLWLDAGYRPSSRLTLGGYFVYGFVIPKVAPASNPLGGGCPENFDCFATGLRAGIQVEYALLDGPVRPWLALGLGYEWVRARIDGRELDLKLETAHSGPEFLHLQLGTDFRLPAHFGLGPFITLSALQYTRCHLQLMGQQQPCEIDAKAWHGWLLLGVRGLLDL